MGIGGGGGNVTILGGHSVDVSYPPGNVVISSGTGGSVISGGQTGLISLKTGKNNIQGVTVNNANGDAIANFDTYNSRFGIGTTEPASMLTVAGTIETTSGGIKFPDGTIQLTSAVSGEGGSGVWKKAGTVVSLTTSTDSVGIGTTNPQNKLDVAGGMVIGADYAGVRTAPSNGLLIQGRTMINYSSSEINGVEMSTYPYPIGLVVSGDAIFLSNDPDAGIITNCKINADRDISSNGTVRGGSIEAQYDIHADNGSIWAGNIISLSDGSVRMIKNAGPGVTGYLGCNTIDCSGGAMINGGLATGGGSSSVINNLTVHGTLSKPGGSFLIDHPLDPKNKVLRHSFVESPEMRNIYEGTVSFNEQGEAVVELPNYFDALNNDFRCQLTCVGGYAPVYIKDEEKGNKFVIAGGKPGLKVYWMVTGTRQDAYAKKNRIVVEEEKGAGGAAKYKPGEYLYPEVFK